ncbi:MAG: hypothetical protein ACLTW9_14265 [Enterocloster sp.]
MEQAVKGDHGQGILRPRFTQNVVYRSDITQSVSALYGRHITACATRLEKEEALFFLLEQVLQEYAAPFKEEDHIPARMTGSKTLCTYMEDHFSDNISLDELTVHDHLWKILSAPLLYKAGGRFPYRYLQTIRLDKAKTFP